MVPLLRVSLTRTPGAAWLRVTFLPVPNESSTAAGGASTVMVTVAVELPAGFCSLYLKVSAPVKAAFTGV